MRGIRSVSLMVFMFLTMLTAQSAYASLTVFQTYTGNYGISTDGFGSTTNSGIISADVPLGATVVAAYLYSATYGGTEVPPSLGTVTLNGDNVTFTSNYINSIPPSYPNWFNTGRGDVTSIIAPTINGGLGGIYDFTVTESLDSTDGEALVVIYSLPSLPTSTIAILDGGAALGGDTATLSFATPLNPSDPGFFAEMQIGDSFSCCSQTSTITVNGNLLTDNAGNNDDSTDASASDGNLITVGGIGDPFSPTNPSYGDDHENYNLVPFITNGDTLITVNTVNPSNDDNIFLATFSVLGVATVCDTPDCANVPEPGVFFLLGSGVLALGVSTWLFRRRLA